MFGRKTLSLAICLLLAFCISGVGVWAEDAPMEDLFKPAAVPGMIFNGNFTASGQTKVASTFRMAPNAFDNDFFVDAAYREQVMSANEYGWTQAAVLSFEKADYVANRANKAIETKPELDGRKVFVRFGEPPTVAPRPLNAVGVTVVTFCYSDPFQFFVPDKPLRKDLEWNPDTKSIDRLIGSVALLLGPPPPPPSPPPGRDGGDQMSDLDDLNGVLDPGSFELERGRGPGRGRDWGNMGPMNLSMTVTKATGRIIEFTMKSFTAKVDFEGNIVIPVTWTDKIDIPFTGYMEFTYDIAARALTAGEYGADCVHDGMVDAGTTKVNLNLNMQQRFKIDRKYDKPFDMVSGITAGSKVFDSAGSTAPLMAAYTKGEDIYLAANWDGTIAWEGLNRCQPIQGMNFAKLVGGISPDGQCALITDGAKVLYSEDAGENFSPLTWRNPPIKKMEWMNTEEAMFIAELENGEFMTFDARTKSMKSKRINAPTPGKKLIAVCAGGSRDSMWRSDSEGVVCTEGDAKPRKMGIAELKSAPQLFKSLDGAFAFVGGVLYRMNIEGPAKLEIANLPEQITAIVNSEMDIYFLNGDGELFKVPMGGGMPTSMMKGVSTIAWRFGTLFAGTGQGVVFPIKPNLEPRPEGQ